MNYSKESIEKKKKNNKSVAKKAKNKALTIALRIIVIVFIVVMFAGIGGAFGIYMGIVENSPEINFEEITPEAYTSIIYDSDGAEIDKLHGDENREYAKLDEIPKYLQDAVVAIEDVRFYTHDGIDLKGIMRAVYVNLKESELSEGASTITQQIIKINILKDYDKTFRRKLQEQYMAVKYEEALVKKLGSKQEAKKYILEVYLNSIALGHGNNGVKAAAKYYFNKELSELTLGECACIAAITQNPSLLTPKYQAENNNDRRKTILTKMLEQKMITEEEFNAAKDEDVYSRITEAFANIDVAATTHSYFVDQVIADVANDLMIRKSKTSAEAYNLIYSGGLSIYTTVDMNMQSILDEVFADDSNYPPNDFRIKLNYYVSYKNKNTDEFKHFGTDNQEVYVYSNDEIQAFIDKYKSDLLANGEITEDDVFDSEVIQKIPQPQAAMVITDFRTGYVKALTGGRGDKSELGQRPLNRSTQSPRLPGSVFKVMAVFAPGIDSGKLTAATTIVDEPFKVGNWAPRNHWGGTFRGAMTVRTAIRDSANVVTVRALMEYVGIDTAWNYLKNFGFTTLVDDEVINGTLKTDKVPSISLGGITRGVTMFDLAGAFGTIANDGMYIKPVTYTKVLDHNGNTLLENIPESKQVMKRDAAFIVTDMMKDVVTSGTGGQAKFRNINMPIAGKTGTTSDDLDLVFAGYTPYYAASIYLGHDIPKSMNYGTTQYHLILWRKVMEKIHENLEYKDFEKPEGISTATICKDTGLLASSLCTNTFTEYFLQGTAPTTTCSSHLSKSICLISGKLATEFCPKEFVEVRNYSAKTPASEQSQTTYPAESGTITTPAVDEYGMPIEYCDIHVSAQTPENENDPLLIDPLTNEPYYNIDGNTTITDPFDNGTTHETNPTDPVIDNPAGTTIPDGVYIPNNEIDQQNANPVTIDGFSYPQ